MLEQRSSKCVTDKNYQKMSNPLQQLTHLRKWKKKKKNGAICSFLCSLFKAIMEFFTEVPYLTLH